MRIRWICSRCDVAGAALAAFRILLLAVIVVMAAEASPATAAPQFSAVTVDARNGKVLYGKDIDGIRHPASLTKMMTLYLLFQELKAGRLDLASPIRISPRATGMAPSRLGAKAGDTITVETAIKALVVKSANDVACAVAEALAGSEKDFAARMTRTARAIGMSRTTFANASGLPNPRQVTTARDMATLGLRLMRDFPQYYPYFRTRSFVYEGRVIRGHNRLLGTYEGTDGIKTGFINASGFNLVTSVRRGDKRLVGVVLGGRTGPARDSYMKQMLSRYFDDAKSGRTIAAYAGSAKGAIVADAPQAAPDTADVDGAEKAAAEPEDGAAEGDGEDTIANLAAQAAAVEPPASAKPAPALVPQEVPAPEPSTPAKVPFKVKTPSEQLADKARVASIAPADEASWAINLGEYRTKTDAQAVLQQLRRRKPDLVAGKTAQTLTVQKGDAVTYRARFSGFDEASAASACAAIRRQKTPCNAQGPS